MKYYSAERNVQLLISLMKQHGVKRVIVSPGATNVTFVASIQQDDYFELYSCVDERSAAYMACGLAFESREPVALSCTGATASRNYYPALTEAFYRKLPVLAITSTQNEGLIGQGVPQVIDRSQQPKDTLRMSVSIPTIQGVEDERYATLRLNSALLELRRGTGGPVHINLATNYSKDYSVKIINPVRIIRRYNCEDELPKIIKNTIAVCVGAHSIMSSELTDSIDLFCEKYNAVVLCDHNSSYHGKYRIQANLILDQDAFESKLKNIDLLIDIGEISGAYFSLKPKEVWRVGEEGELRDTYKTLSTIFQMSEKFFFNYYSHLTESEINTSYFQNWKDTDAELRRLIPELPFSNIWVAQEMSKRIPSNSMMYFAILNSLRSWNFFELPDGVDSFSNTGGFGIDGGLSSLIGASLFDKLKLYFAVVGDLSFFYDINVIGNRHIGPNVRIVVINNGVGMEFKNYHHNASIHEEKVNDYIAAAGHFGNKSQDLVRNFAENLGFLYLSASCKEEYIKNIDCFTSSQIGDRPILFEIFTDAENENEALKSIRNIKKDSLPSSSRFSSKMKKSVLNALGDKRTKALKDLIKG